MKKEEIEGLWNSKAYFPLLLGTAAVFLFVEKNLPAMLLMAGIFSIFMMFCADMLAALLPMLLIFLLGTAYYEDISALLPYWWVGVICICSLIIHFLNFPVDIKGGRSLKSLSLVAVATLMGGIGTISAQEYFSLTSLYYTLFLGVGMLAFYLMLRAELGRKRYYNVQQRLITILYAVGIFAGFVVINYYISHLSTFLNSLTVLDIKYRNYCATILLTALPMPCFFIKQRRVHVLGLGFMYLSLLLTGSRSALFIGTALVALCMLYLHSHKVRHFRKRRTRTILFILSALVLLVIFANTIYSSRSIGGSLVNLRETRMLLYRRAFEDFLRTPLFGQGLGSMKNSVLYIGVTGSMFWYHNYFAQIIGSMGIVGIIAYSYLLKDRLSMLKELKGTDYWVFALSYFGMLLISMTNPGEFCPFPNEFLMVILFAVTEDLLERRITYAVIPIKEYNYLKRAA